MIDFSAALERESARFAELTSEADPAASVPSCPDWSVADLTWHLLEVQYLWTNIVAGLLESPDSVPELDRPADSDLPAMFKRQSADLLTALANHDDVDACWSWHDGGHNVGWVRRRQAHEALIHRVDAELAAGGLFAVDAPLAADGVDEVLHVMLDCRNIPSWATFTPDGSTAAIQADDGPMWAVQLGRFTGTSPNSGNNYDDPALMLVDPVENPSVVVAGTAADLDLWLWGRGSLETLRTEGDVAVARLIRRAAIEGTQ